MDRALLQVIEAELEPLNRDELVGGWRCLCAMMLLRTANLMTSKMLSNKDFIRQRKEARLWLDTETTGTISFESACETLNVDASTLRNRMITHAEKLRQSPIITTPTGQPRMVFGRHSGWATPISSGSCSTGPRSSTS